LKHVKIVATIGPQTCSVPSVNSLVDAGMSVARLNGSHANLDWHAAAIELVRTEAPQIPILLDIPGRKIRTLQLEHEPTFAAGGSVILTTSREHSGREKVPVSYAHLHHYVRVGDTVLADDGTLWFTVTGIEGPDICCRAETAGTLKSRKGINVPSADFPVEPLTERDVEMLEFAKQQGVDFVGISFVDEAARVEEVRVCLGAGGPQVLSKVENMGAMNNLDEVIQASDAIMIDRGDLSVETNLETLALSQKRIVDSARRNGKPVIVATEMLHSMIANPFPTKAEICDISNAVLDGASALMLSGETAIGRFPAEAVSLMCRVVEAVSQHPVPPGHDRDGDATSPRAMGEAIAVLCRRLPITKIVAVTISGYAAQIVASYRPTQPILGVSNDARSARCMNLLYGTEGVHVDISFSRGSTDHIAQCLEELWRHGRLMADDFVLVTAVGYPKSGNRMNMIQTHRVADLIESLKWS
jgi:pyruvate kinase